MIVVGALVLAGLVAIGSANPTGMSCFLPHEVYNPCHKPCAASCDNRHPVCDGECVGGCVCEEPYVRNRKGHCVLFDGCGGGHHHGHHVGHHGHHGHHGHRGHHGHHDRWHHGRRHWKCGHNEKFKRCKRTCEATCKKRHPHDCREPCIDFGCQCESGFVRNRHGDCIPYDLCPSRKHHCGRNERHSNETNLPERLCQTPRCKHQKFPKNCPRYSTKGGCVCKDGFVRNNRARCVKEDHCHHRSGSDSRWDSHWDSDSSDSDGWSRSRSSDRSTRSWDRDRSRRHRRRYDSSESRSRGWDSDSWDSDSWNGSWDSDSDSWDRSSGRRRGRGHRKGRHGRRRHGGRHAYHRGHRHNDRCHCTDDYDYRTDQHCYDYCRSDGCEGDGCFNKRK